MEELKEDKQIELRSEEVQEIMGQVPPMDTALGYHCNGFPYGFVFGD